MRCFALLLVFGWVFANAKDLQIIQTLPFGEKNVRITFDRQVVPNDVKQMSSSETENLLEVKAVLKSPPKNYRFSDKTRVDIAQHSAEIVRIVMKMPKGVSSSLEFSNQHLYIRFNASKASKKATQTKQMQQAKQAKPTKQAKPIKQVAQAKQAKQRRVVLDPGHGGKDCGAIGVLKICEKIITLKVAKLLESELKKRGYIVHMTRDRDYYLGLQERTKFANTKRADLFISIHANSIPKTSNKETNGVETYFLSTARSERARRVAEKENKDSIDVMNFFSKQNFLNSINAHRLVASNKLAIDIQGGILKKLRSNYSKVVDGGVREGPFWVLAGALMPSVLIEVGYLSHPQEGRRITHREYQADLASGIANGIDGYFQKNP